MTTTGTSDPYTALGLKRGAGHQEIRRAYFRLVREHPPETDPEAFKAIRAAYEQLRSAERRAETDLYLVQAPPPRSPRVASGLNGLPQVFDLSLPRSAVLDAAKARTDLAQDDFRDDYEAIHLQGG